MNQLVHTNNRLRQGAKWLILSAIFSMVSFGVVFLYFKPSKIIEKPLDLKIMSVKKDSVEKVINETGIVQLGEQQILESPLEGGIVDKTLVQTGDSISSGQLLVVLGDPERQMALLQQPLKIEQQKIKIANNQEQESTASQQLQIAKKNLQNLNILEAKINEEELQQIRNQERIQEYSQLLNTANLELQDFRNLQQQGVLPMTEVRNKQEKLLTLTSQQKDAQLAMKTNKLVIEQLKTELRSQKEQLTQEISQAQTKLENIKLSTRQERLELKRLQLEMQTIEEKSQTLLIHSNLNNGRVLDISTKVGAVVKLGEPLLTIGKPSMEIVQVELLPSEAKKIQIGQFARLTTIGANAQTFAARVIQIADLASPKISDPATVTVTIRLEKPNGSLISGSLVDVELVIEQVEDAITLDRSVIQGSGKNTFVWVRNEQNRVEQRNITLGLEGLTSVEVKSGLNFGDQVILPSPDLNLKSGMPIMTNNN